MIVLTVHIGMMTISMGAMSLALVGALFGRRQAVAAAKIATGTALLGTVTGIHLLLAHPVALTCALLTSYLAVVVLLYRYVFAMGDARQCSWLQSNN